MNNFWDMPRKFFKLEILLYKEKHNILFKEFILILKIQKHKPENEAKNGAPPLICFLLVLKNHELKFVSS